MDDEFDVKICCMGAGYVGGPTMAVIAKMCPRVSYLSFRRFLGTFATVLLNEKANVGGGTTYDCGTEGNLAKRFRAGLS